MANSAGFEMNIAITTVAIGSGGPFKIADHRKGHAGVTGQVLAKAKSSSSHALVANFHLFQLVTLRPEPVDAASQAIHSVSIQVQLNETPARKISQQPLGSAPEDRG